MYNDIKSKLKRMAINAILEDIMDFEDDSEKEITFDYYIKLMKIEFIYEEMVSGLSSSRIDAVLTVKSHGEEIYYFRMNIAR